MINFLIAENESKVKFANKKVEELLLLNIESLKQTQNILSN